MQTSDDDPMARLNKMIEINKLKNDETFGPWTPSTAGSNTSDTIIVDPDRDSQGPESPTRNRRPNAPVENVFRGQSPIQAALEKEFKKGSQAPAAQIHSSQNQKFAEKNAQVINATSKNTIDTPFGLAKFPTKKHAAGARDSAEVAAASIQQSPEPANGQIRLNLKTHGIQSGVSAEVVQKELMKKADPQPKLGVDVLTLQHQEASSKQMGPPAKPSFDISATQQQSRASPNGGQKDLCRELSKVFADNLAMQIMAKRLPGQEALSSELENIFATTIRHLEADLKWALKKHEDDKASAT
jgi:hypothetical protein